MEAGPCMCMGAAKCGVILIGSMSSGGHVWLQFKTPLILWGGAADSACW